MDISVELQRGFNGPQFDGMTPISVDPGLIDLFSDWGGSYHILEMGDHYRSYVIDLEKVELPSPSDFPCEKFYDTLKNKTNATAVTGNIGQCLAIIYATTFFETMNISDIAILDAKRPFKKRKTPDFLMRLRKFREVYSEIIKGVSPTPLLIWWPVECKSRSEIVNNSKEPQQSALLQLISYWMTIVDEYPENVGYGIITTFTYKHEKKLFINIILLKNRSLLEQQLKALNALNSDEKSTKFKSFKKMYEFLKLGETLHDV